jgi:ParB-like chromosome segregation protein Spo0J
MLSAVRKSEETETEQHSMRLRDSKGITEGRIDILYCDPAALKVEDGFNIRDLSTPLAREKLDALKAEVKEHGIQTPLKIRFDGQTKWIVEGHRRHKVVMELIAEHKASKGAEGRKIEAVPIYAEATGTTALDRDYGLKTSNSGEKLEPLEFANLIYRTIHQRGISEQEAAKGFGISITVLRNHLKMRAMPEEDKQRVRDGDISATLASKVARDARTDPEFRAEIEKGQPTNSAASAKRASRRSGRATSRQRRKPRRRNRPPTPSPRSTGTSASPSAAPWTARS